MGFALFTVLPISAQVRNPRRKSSFFILFCCASVASHSLKVQSLAHELGKVSGENMNPSERQNDGSGLGGGPDTFLPSDSILLLPKAEGTCMADHNGRSVALLPINISLSNLLLLR